MKNNPSSAVKCKKTVILYDTEHIHTRNTRVTTNKIVVVTLLRNTTQAHTVNKQLTFEMLLKSADSACLNKTLMI
jgi:hypothetical protein